MSDLANNDLLVETIEELSYEELLLTLTHKQEQRIVQLINTQETLLGQIAQLNKDVIGYLAKPAVKGAGFTKQSQELREQQTDFVQSLEGDTDTEAAIAQLQQELVRQRKQKVLAEYKREVVELTTPEPVEPASPTAKPFDPTADLEQDEDPTLIMPQAAQLLGQLSVKFIT